MKYKLATAGVVAVALVLSTVSVSGIGRRPADAAPRRPTAPAPGPLRTYEPSGQATTSSSSGTSSCSNTIKANPAATGPTVTARALGVLHTATYDAWAAYDPVAKGTRLGSQLRRPTAERTRGQQDEGDQLRRVQDAELAIPGPPDVHFRPYDDQMAASATTRPTTPRTGATPAGVGNTAAQAVIDYRSTDNSNQAGNYADTTGYAPKNTWNTTPYPWHWQPLCVLKPAGVAAGRPPTPSSGDCPAESTPSRSRSPRSGGTSCPSRSRPPVPGVRAAEEHGRHVTRPPTSTGR